MMFPMYTPASAEHFADFQGLRSFLGLFAGELNQPKVIREPHSQKNREGPPCRRIKIYFGPGVPDLCC